MLGNVGINQELVMGWKICTAPYRHFREAKQQNTLVINSDLLRDRLGLVVTFFHLVHWDAECFLDE